jgi:hypothetical protein
MCHVFMSTRGRQSDTCNIHMADSLPRVLIYTWHSGHVVHNTHGRLSNCLPRVLWATWHNGHVYLLYTWQIVQFATTESTTPPTRGHLHVANCLPRVWPLYTWRPASRGVCGPNWAGFKCFPQPAPQWMGLKIRVCNPHNEWSTRWASGSTDWDGFMWVRVFFFFFLFFFLCPKPSGLWP